MSVLGRARWRTLRNAYGVGSPTVGTTSSVRLHICVVTLYNWNIVACDVKHQYTQQHSFPHFSPTYFDILSWNFVCHFVLINIRSCSCVVNVRHICWSKAPFGTANTVSAFSPTCFDILSWNFVCDFVWIYLRSSLNVVTLREFLKELWLFCT